MTMTAAQARSPRQIRRRRDVMAMVSAARERYRRDQPPCWLCRQGIDYSIVDPDDDGVLEVDHFLEVSRFPDLAADPENARPSHRGCNRFRNRAPGFIGATDEPVSTDWEGMAGP